MPQKAKVTMRRKSDGVTRTFDKAFIEANEAKFKGWTVVSEVPAKAALVDSEGGKSGKGGKKAATKENDDDDGDDENGGDGDDDPPAEPPKRKSRAKSSAKKGDK